jgi:hypothetical protein
MTGKHLTQSEQQAVGSSTAGSGSTSNCKHSPRRPPRRMYRTYVLGARQERTMLWRRPQPTQTQRKHFKEHMDISAIQIWVSPWAHWDPGLNHLFLLNSLQTPGRHSPHPLMGLQHQSVSFAVVDFGDRHCCRRVGLEQPEHLGKRRQLTCSVLVLDT